MAYIDGKEILFSAQVNQSVSDIDIVQGKGSNPRAVMSQDAVTKELNNLEGKINKASRHIVVENYRELVDLLLTASEDAYKAGQGIRVRQNNVPDLWISDVDIDNYISYEYTTDEQLIADINNADTLYRLSIGHYAISLNEVEKPDLSPYAKTSEVTALRNEVNTLNTEVNAKIVITDKRLANLEAGLPSEDFMIDNSTAYVRDVPSNALPFAEVAEIGGVTRKCTNLIPFPYIGVSGTSFGTTYTIKEDGSIVFSGKPTSGFTVVLCEKTFTAGSYYLGDNCTKVGVNFIAFDIDGGAVLSYEGAFTLSKITKVRVYYLISTDFDGTTTVYPMLNSGETALPYEPFFEGLRSAPVTEVVSEGVNSFGGEALANKIVKVAGGVIDEESQTVRFLSTNINGKVLFDNFKPNTVYTFILSGWNAYGNGSNLIVAYTDGTVDYLAFTASQTHSVIVFKSNSTKSVKGLYGINYADYTYLYYNQCGIFEGDINAEEFKPYIKRTLAIPEAVRPAHGIPNTDCYDRIRWRYDDATYKWVREKEKQMEETVLDGSSDEVWLLFKRNDYGAYVYYTPLKSKQRAISDKFTFEYGAWGNKGVGYFSPNGNDVFFNTDKATVEEWKTHIAENPVTVFYELAEPVITDISDILPEDNLIGVQAGGTMKAENEFDYDVPMTVRYRVDTEVI